MPAWGAFCNYSSERVPKIDLFLGVKSQERIVRRRDSILGIKSKEGKASRRFWPGAKIFLRESLSWDSGSRSCYETRKLARIRDRG